MKKILLSAFACSPIRGSEENNGWSWAVGLAQKGYEVWCCTNSQDIIECLEEKEKLGLKNLHFIPVTLNYNLDKYLFDSSSKTIYLHYYFWKKKAAKILKELHQIEHFEIAHHVSYGSFQQGSPLYKLKNCKVIFGPVGGGQMALPIFKPFFENHWKTEVIRGAVSNLMIKYNASLRKTLKIASTVLAVNQETLDLLNDSKLFKGKSAQVMDASIPAHYESLKYVEKSKGKQLNILWIGRLLPRKGLNLSLKALSFLPKDFDYKFTIVGGGQMEKSVDKWIKNYGLDKSKIILRGKIPFSEVSTEYQKADVMLFCSLRDTSGNQVLEAMAHGVPVVVLNLSGMVTMVPDSCGIKINPETTLGTAKDIAKAIEKMGTDDLLRQKAGKAAYHYAMGCNWKNKIDMLTSKYYTN